MNDILDNLTILTFIRDVYPVSFIAIILASVGYLMGYMVFNKYCKFLQNLIERSH